MSKVRSVDKTLVAVEKSTGAVIWRCSVSEVFRKIAKNSQKYLC